MRMQVRSLASLSGLRIWTSRELWCRSQMQLGSHVAVVEAGSCTSDATPSLGTSMCRGCGRKKIKKKTTTVNTQIPGIWRDKFQGDARGSEPYDS